MQTEWFEGTTKPSVDGMYKRKFPTTGNHEFWARFEGGVWLSGDSNYENAKAEKTLSAFQDSGMWAGCTETDWISGQILPVHEGVYKRRIAGDYWAKFKNGQWYMAYSDYEAAKKTSAVSKQQNLFPWCGVHCE